MQRFVRFSAAALLSLAALNACGDKVTVTEQPTATPSVKGIAVTPSSQTLKIGDAVVLVATVTADAGITDRTVSWLSSDATVASVDANGRVVALKAGAVSVTATSKADTKVSSAASITVLPASISITSITPATANLNFGQTVTLFANVTADASITNKSVTWTSSDATIASVNATTGVVTASAAKAGTVAIIATTVSNTSVTSAATITVLPAVPANVAVSVAPSSAVLSIGSTLQLVATVTADASVTNRAVTWSSSNVAVATVSNAAGTAGVVTAVAAGSVAITATSAANTAVTSAASITVPAAPTAIPAVVSIVAINQGVGGGAGSAPLGNPVNLQNASGQLDVDISYDPGTQKVTNVDLLITGPGVTPSPFTCDSRIVGNGIAASAAVTTATLSCNTAAFNTTTGVTTFKNGQYTLSAKLTVTGATPSTATSTAVTFNNADVLRGRYITTAMTQAPDAAGNAWVAGGVNVEILPVFYTLGRSLGTPLSVNLVNVSGAQATGPAGAAVANNGTVVGQQVPLSAPGTAVPTTYSFANTAGVANSVAGASVNGMTIAVVAVDNLGAAAPALTIAGGNIRLDNLSPLAGTYAFNLNPPVNTQVGSNNWIGAAYQFRGDVAGFGYVPAGGLFGAANTNDNGVVAGTTGVGRVTVTYETAAPGSPVWTAVTIGSGLARSTTPGNPVTYRLRITEKDALGNQVQSIPQQGGQDMTFGVDFAAPIGINNTAISYDNTAANAGANEVGVSSVAIGKYLLLYSDSLSGFNNATPAEYTVVRNFFASPVVANCIVGAFANGVCSNLVGQPPQVFSDGTVAGNGPIVGGYYTINALVRDQAGNASANVSRTVGVDAQVPQFVGGVTIPAFMTGGSAQSFSASATDDLDLLAAQGALTYPGAGNLRIGSNTGALGLVASPRTGFVSALTAASAVANFTAGASGPGFIRSLGQTAAPTAGGAAQGNSAPPNAITIRAIDPAGTGWASGVTSAIAANNVEVGVNPGGGALPNPFGVGGTFGMTVTNGNALPVIRNGNNNDNVTLNGILTGPISVTSPFFNQVCFYYTNNALGQAGGFGATGDLIFIGCSTAPQIQDIVATQTRTFTFSTTFNPSTTLGTAGNLFLYAVGLTAGFDGVITQPTNNTLGN